MNRRSVYIPETSGTIAGWKSMSSCEEARVLRYTWPCFALLDADRSYRFVTQNRFRSTAWRLKRFGEYSHLKRLQIFNHGLKAGGSSRQVLAVNGVAGTGARP
jgi:hypothetical protein